MTTEPSSPDEKPELPMFAPNPDLVVHVEGNKKWEKWFKDRVREAAEEAEREWGGDPRPGLGQAAATPVAVSHAVAAAAGGAGAR